MRGALLVVLLIAMLIVGILIIKDLGTENTEGISKQEVIEKAEETVETAGDAIQNLTDKARKTVDY